MSNRIVRFRGTYNKAGGESWGGVKIAEPLIQKNHLLKFWTRSVFFLLEEDGYAIYANMRKRIEKYISFRNLLNSEVRQFAMFWVCEQLVGTKKERSTIFTNENKMTAKNKKAKQRSNS